MSEEGRPGGVLKPAHTGGLSPRKGPEEGARVRTAQRERKVSQKPQQKWRRDPGWSAAERYSERGKGRLRLAMWRLGGSWGPRWVQTGRGTVRR